MPISFTVNGTGRQVDVPADTPLLYVLRNDLQVGSPQFGCGLSQCGACSVLVDGKEVRSCVLAVRSDTDRTPDGGFSAGFLEYGGQNLRKAAAYTYQAILDLASTTLEVHKNQLTVKDGVITGGGKRLTYGELVRGQELKLTIPIEGELTTMFGLTVAGKPPMKPTRDYAIIGNSFANTVTPGKVMGLEQWVTNVRLPNMLHGRVVHPKTLGSTLVAAGTLDKAKFPNARVVVKGNLVGVVAPSEWEAVKAAQDLANTTKWTEWKALPGHTQVHQWMREKADWASTPVAKGAKNSGAVAPAFASAAKTLKASYELPYMKHAPIGPTIAVGDVRPDGTVFVHTHNQNPQALRGQIAMMLGTPVDNVVVRIYAGPGHYGRSNGGNAGAEDEAVILSQTVGQPVHVSGCVQRICSGRRSRRPPTRMSGLASTPTASSRRTKRTTTCPPGKTTG